jgi:hypothetical protein
VAAYALIISGEVPPDLEVLGLELPYGAEPRVVGAGAEFDRPIMRATSDADLTGTWRVINPQGQDFMLGRRWRRQIPAAAQETLDTFVGEGIAESRSDHQSNGARPTRGWLLVTAAPPACRRKPLRRSLPAGLLLCSGVPASRLGPRIGLPDVDAPSRFVWLAASCSHPFPIKRYEYGPEITLGAEQPVFVVTPRRGQTPESGV